MSALVHGIERHSASNWLHTASAELATQIAMHPFLVRCRDGTITLPELLEFLVQQGKYSSYFTRYLCALMSQLEDGQDVLHLAANLSEELGYGGGAGEPHSVLYDTLLKDFGLSPQQHPTLPETQSLIDTMFMLCRQTGGLAGLGALCLGAEAIVPVVYSSIIAGFQSRGISLERLKFFSIHVDCDDGHADTMRQIIERKVRESRSSTLVVLSSAEIAINARLRFFTGLTRGQQ